MINILKLFYISQSTYQIGGKYSGYSFWLINKPQQIYDYLKDVGF